MIPWSELQKKEISKKELREQYIATQAVVIQAFGRVGAFLFENYDCEEVESYVLQHCPKIILKTYKNHHYKYSFFKFSYWQYKMYSM